MSFACPKFLLACLAVVAMVGLAHPASAQSPGSAGSSPAAAVPGLDPATYRVGAEDLLEISVWREDALKKEVLVRPDGGISYPADRRSAGRGQDRRRSCARRSRSASRSSFPMPPSR